MRIGILTLPQETNYGGVLQAFALQYTLRKLGHDAITIDRHNRRQYPSLLIHCLGYGKRLVEHYLKHRDVSVRWNPFQSDEDFTKSLSEVRSFIDRNMKMTYPVYSDQLHQIERDYCFDAYVVGSDQIWFDDYCPNSFLDFVKRENVLKVTYAASSSSRSFLQNRKKTLICAELAKSFQGISVREKQLVELCASKIGITPLWVIDPTMLLDPKDYMDVVSSHNEVGPSVFTYILDENSEKEAIVREVNEQTGLPVIKGNSKNMIEGVSVPVSVDLWLCRLASSEFVITDSFHGTVFSILFNKPFISIVNKARGEERFTSLLGMFGLTERLVYDADYNVLNALIDKPIDYEKVNSILQVEREKAIGFLMNSLK